MESQGVIALSKGALGKAGIAAALLLKVVLSRGACPAVPAATAVQLMVGLLREQRGLLCLLCLLCS